MPTPFSQTIVRDTFTRANSGTLGASWTALSDATDTQVLGITSNAAQPQVTGGRAASFWNASTFQANQYSQVIVSGSATGTNTHLGGPIVRASAGGNYYLFTWNELNGGSDLQIAKVVSGVFTSLNFTSNGPAVLGSLLRLEIVGTQLNAYIDGNLVLSASDSSLSSGAPGITGFMAAASPTFFMTNWEGGNLLWTRQGTVIPIGANGGTEEPSVIYESNPKILSPNADGKIWKMWFTSGWNPGTINIFYAESNDGITWTQYSGNPVLTDGANAPSHGYVTHIGNTYYAFMGDAFTFSLGFSRWTSSDGLTWAKTNSGVLLPGSAGTWDDMGLFNPVVWDAGGGTWNMLYTGRTTTGSQLYAVGLATSTNLGVTWTKYVSNPVIPAGPAPANGKIVVKNGSQYYMWGFTATASAILPTDHALYTSPDLHTWTACAKNPVYERVLLNEGTNLATGQVADPVMIELNGTTYLFYDTITTQAAGKIHINLATAPFTILQVMGMVLGSSIIAGNVGVAGVTVSYSGAASGSVTSDVNGNYTIPILTNGSYTITPTLGGFAFTPTSSNQTPSGTDITGVNFTSLSLSNWISRYRKFVNKR